VFLAASSVRVPSSDAEQIARRRMAFPPLNQADKPLCHPERALAYLSDGSGVLVMPAGIKKACMTSRASEAGRQSQLTRVPPKGRFNCACRKNGARKGAR
jgi:hypothetical protein